MRVQVHANKARQVIPGIWEIEMPNSRELTKEVRTVLVGLFPNTFDTIEECLVKELLLANIVPARFQVKIKEEETIPPKSKTAKSKSVDEYDNDTY